MTKLSGTGEMVAQDLFTSSATQLMELGAYTESADGRGYRYCYMGGVAGVPGKIYQSIVEDTSNLQNIQGAVAAIGATTIATTGTGTIAANLLSGATMVVTKGTGAGYTYRIKSNKVAAGAVYSIVLEDPIIVALDATSYLDFCPSPYYAVVVDPVTATSSPAGVCVYAIPINNYGWLQTHGAVGCLAQGALAVGESVCAANTTNAGAVAAVTGVTPPVGYALTGTATTEYGHIFLTID